MCRHLNVSRSAYHQWQSRSPSVRQQTDEVLTKHIKALHIEYKQTYGRRRLYHALKNDGLCVSESRIARLMRKHHLYAHSRRKWRPSKPSNTLIQAPNNEIKPIEVTQRDQIWVTDITYLKTQQGWLYLAAVLDKHTRQVIGWAMDSRMRTELVERALVMALRGRRPDDTVIVHSDQGSQYMSMAYQRMLKKLGFKPSASRRGNCYDNATMESFWHSLKVESLYRHKILSVEQTRSLVFEYVETFYNSKRLHSALNYMTPNQFDALHQTSS
jgi:transposase InsO family protein